MSLAFYKQVNMVLYLDRSYREQSGHKSTRVTMITCKTTLQQCKSNGAVERRSPAHSSSQASLYALDNEAPQCLLLLQVYLWLGCNLQASGGCFIQPPPHLISSHLISPRLLSPYPRKVALGKQHSTHLPTHKHTYKHWLTSRDTAKTKRDLHRAFAVIRHCFHNRDDRDCHVIFFNQNQVCNISLPFFLFSTIDCISPHLT